MCYRLLPCHLSALEYSIKPTSALPRGNVTSSFSQGSTSRICSLALVQPALSCLPGACLLELLQPHNQHFQQELNDIIEPGGGTAAAAGDDDASFWGCSGICSKAGYSAIGQFRAQLAATSKWYHCGSIQIEAGGQLLGCWVQLTWRPHDCPFAVYAAPAPGDQELLIVAYFGSQIRVLAIFPDEETICHRQ
ncbi:hypothetical protein B0H19DRAFT_1073011 [Mycena capillaripes]|nr:hypothetical protein B0H19DRAFT_1073011 [Mycena capillaripes]